MSTMKADPASSEGADFTDKQSSVTLAARPSPACWLVFAAAIVVSVFVHELGHCTVPWLHGYPAIPTPAKEYILKPLPEAVQNQMALGGIIGSVLALVAAAVEESLISVAAGPARTAPRPVAPADAVRPDSQYIRPVQCRARPG